MVLTVSCKTGQNLAVRRNGGKVLASKVESLEISCQVFLVTCLFLCKLYLSTILMVTSLSSSEWS